jgi:2-oxoglutarate ferredoxin oxidoreductase subunit alpha
MQVTGGQFATTTAIQGNDLATFPDFPAEIRAPQGTLAGVSAFQIHFSSQDILTPGDAPAVLVAMNPAALIASLPDLVRCALIIANTDKFGPRDLDLAGLKANPLEDGTLDGFQVVEAPIGKLTKAALEGMGLSTKEIDRCKNFFALGMMYWLYQRESAATERWVRAKFKAPIDEANLKVLHAGHAFAETVEVFRVRYEVPRAKLRPGTYRNITGNQALVFGLLAAAQKAKRPLFLGAYPITPASDILHQMAGFKDLGAITFQAEDEIAAIGAAIGASWGGSIGVTTTAGPGFTLKMEAMGLAVMTELPLVIVDVQRGGPSTGLPTKTEQADLLQALYGRHGEAPLPVLASSTPSDSFETAVEAVRIALQFMTPVVLLHDGYLANGTEPWRLPDLDAIPEIPVHFATDPVGFLPYRRDDRLVRNWAIPGTPGLEHRIGGLEKQDISGNVSYDPANHDHMCRVRAERIAGIAKVIPEIVPHGDPDGTLVLSWGGTFGAVRTAVDTLRSQGRRTAHVHLRWLNPFPSNLREILDSYHTVVVPELNLGQLSRLIRAEFLVDAVALTQISGRPFKVADLIARIARLQPAEAK